MWNDVVLITTKHKAVPSWDGLSCTNYLVFWLDLYLDASDGNRGSASLTRMGIACKT